MSKKRKKKGSKQAKKKPTRRRAASEQTSSKRQPSPAPSDLSEFAPWVPLSGDLMGEEELLAVMRELRNLQDAPEFRGLVATLEEDMAQVVLTLMSETDAEMQRLGDAGDGEGISRLLDEARDEAFRRLITPVRKADIRKRLVRLKRRLQRSGHSQRAASVDRLIQLVDQPDFKWATLPPLADAFRETVDQVGGDLLLDMSLAEAAGMTLEEFLTSDRADLFDDPVIARRIFQRLEGDKELREIIDARFDRLYEELHEALFEGEIDLGLYTTAEVAMWDALAQHRLEQAGVDLEDAAAVSVENARITMEALIETVRRLNEPERRARWLERLEQIESEVSGGPVRALVALMRPLLSRAEPDNPELQSWLQAAYTGEAKALRARMDEDETLAEAFEAAVEKARARLKS